MKRSVKRTDATSTRIPISAGIVASIVAFSAAFSIVIGGLEAAGASHTQAVSGLVILAVVSGAISVFMSWRTRMPLTAAWSTPGAALLMATPIVAGGWPVAVGAFVVCGILLAVTGFFPVVSRLVQRIPATLIQAMLAGILFPLVVAPVSAVASSPLTVAPILIVWLILNRFRPQWAILGALVTTLTVIGFHITSTGITFAPAEFIPRLEWTTPEFTLQACISLALPLYIVTMASQNIPGVAVMQSFGYTIPWRSPLALTGVGSALTAPLGGHAINLAAISAALIAGPEAGPHGRRWIAGMSAGGTSIMLGILSPGLATLILAGPAGVLPALAGVALLPTFVSAISQSFAIAAQRVPAALTFLVAASGISVLGLSSAFWALATGLVVRGVLTIGRPRGAHAPKATRDTP
ncbi:Benzoate transport protein [Leucobacter sp. 7(1)]|uniref:benzoate/H(+) symporter BenE family transporter n=1 Tax=Leucobacter sp. 7(1) TaxID=1255613 RepID=UPI00097ECF7F|nr:benzoate/H(+) symporter BenE family transporter [Leucobacter sp. 7(1)]SJN09857.1 Benzoate transport protein [Leucobacter sp. 7(1)]